jgi:hypothetical protein
MFCFNLSQIAVDGTMSVAQAFIDEDEEESFYATAWTHSVSFRLSIFASMDVLH